MLVIGGKQIEVLVSFTQELNSDMYYIFFLHHITLQTIYSSLSKSNFKDHCGDAATQQCLGMITEINEYSVSDEML